MISRLRWLQHAAAFLAPPVAFVLLPAAALLLPAPGLAQDAPGKKLFGTDCGLCHQRNGEGVPGQFPRLAGRVGLIAAKPEGKAYLTHVLASGMTGAVAVDGHTIVGYMPPFGQVPPADIATILTFVSGLGGTSPVTFSADDIIAARKTPMSAQAVHAERLKLVAAKVIP